MNPSTIIREAQRRGRLTVDSLRAAMIDADCDHTSRAHVANLLSGKAAWSAHDLEVAFAHVGTRGLLDTLAESEGAVVSYPDARDAGHLLAEVVHLTRESAALADEVVNATDARGDGGVTVTDAERQALVTRARSVHARLGAVLPMVAGRRGAA